jgi:hypothetical protein
MSAVEYAVDPRVARITLNRLRRGNPVSRAFEGLAAREGFRAALRARDEPSGDLRPSTFKG